MNANLKGALHGIIAVVGNGAILLVLPDPIKMYAILAFNLLQVVYAFIDPSYTVQQIAAGKLNQFGKKI